MALETPKYKVIEKDSNIEIRLYEKFTVAKTNVQSNYESATSTGFRRIANYIFGGNEKNIEISMTAPVISTSPSIFPSSYDIMFFMPSEHSRESLPNPNLSTVKIEDVNFGKIASIKFGGWATNDNCIKYHKKLEEYLDGLLGILVFLETLVFLVILLVFLGIARRLDKLVEHDRAVQ